jgi:hypothetical protein
MSDRLLGLELMEDHRSRQYQQAYSSAFILRKSGICIIIIIIIIIIIDITLLDPWAMRPMYLFSLPLLVSAL